MENIISKAYEFYYECHGSHISFYVYVAVQYSNRLTARSFILSSLFTLEE